MEGVKIVCRKCNEERSAAEMRKEPTCKNGFSRICKNCDHQRNKEYREAQKENPEWIEKEKERHKKYNEEID